MTSSEPDSNEFDQPQLLPERAINGAFSQPKFWSEIAGLCPPELLRRLGRGLCEGLERTDESGSGLQAVRRFILAGFARAGVQQRLPTVFQSCVVLSRKTVHLAAGLP